jgi:hypothetical protein
LESFLGEGHLGKWSWEVGRGLLVEWSCEGVILESGLQKGSSRNVGVLGNCPGKMTKKDKGRTREY